MAAALQMQRATDTPRPTDRAAGAHAPALPGLNAVDAFFKLPLSIPAASSPHLPVEPVHTARVIGRTRHEDEILSAAPIFLNRALQLKDWFTRAGRTGGFDQKFDLTRSFHRPETSYGFFGRIETGENGVLPVMGAVEDMFYDRTRTPSDRRLASAQWMKEQIREFVLRYFMRISSFRPARGVVETRRRGATKGSRLFPAVRESKRQRPHRTFHRSFQMEDARPP